MLIKLVPGSDFSPGDVAASPDNTIQLYGYAGGILVGGMSYQVDPKRKPPEPGGWHDRDECGRIGQELLKCIEVHHEKVRRVRVRKVTVDLEIEGIDSE
jgi:zinc metalloprotease ZmpB